MTKLHRNLCSSLMILLCLAGSIRAQERSVPVSKISSAKMREYVNKIRNPRTDKIPADQLPPASGYFVRIAPRRRVLTSDKEIDKTAVLAAPQKPFVFLTTPESIYGKSLLEIYEEIGYEAESIIRDPGEDMVAIVFRYADEVRVSNVQDGNLENDWSNRIYETTWDNLMLCSRGWCRTNRMIPVRSRMCRRRGSVSRSRMLILC